jgi:glycosyltransferase involved in cell wall biosynthesis
MSERKTIVLVLKSGGDFAFRDVELIARHINGKWRSEVKPRIICLWDKITKSVNMGMVEFIPLTNDLKGTWARMQCYSPEMEQYRPFLYVDLDTAVIQSLENIFELIENPDMFILLEDFYQKGQLATGLVWFPANHEGIKKVWENRDNITTGSWRMDYFLRQHIKPDTYWQRLTNTIYDFKPQPKGILSELPKDADLVCFHGKPRIFQCAEASISLAWVKQYVEQSNFEIKIAKKKVVTVIIPYKEDRGWLKEAVLSVPDGVELILSQGEGNWPQNFNKALKEATGDYIKYLHEDDMLTPNCIEDSVRAIEEQNVDFIHGNAVELFVSNGNQFLKKPFITNPTLQNLKKKNVIHSATTMYRREVFETVGLFNESNKVKSFEEYEFNLRCLKAGLKIGYCDSTLAVYRRHPKQIIRTVDNVERKHNRNKLLNEYR